MRFFKSLGFKITVYFILVGIIPFFLIAGLVYFKISVDIRGMLERHMDALVLQVGNTVDQTISNAYWYIGALADNPVIKSKDKSFKEKLEEIQKVQDFYRLFEDITLLDSKGVVLASTAYNYRGELRFKQWFQEAKSGKTFISNVYVVTAPFRLVFTVASPILGKGGSVEGVIAGQVNIDVIRNIADSVKIGKTGRILIIDGSGNYLVYRLGNFLFEKMYPLQGRKALLDAPKGFVEYRNREGVDRVCVFRSLEGYGEYKGLGWKIGLVQDKKEAFAILAKTSEYLVFALIFGMCVILVLLAVFIYSLLVPIRTLLRETERVAQGDLSERQLEISDDEIGDLTESFKKMTTSLRGSREKILQTSKYLKSVISNMADSLVVLDRKEAVNMVNPAFLNLLSYKEEDIIGRPFSSFVLEEESFSAQGLFKRLLKEGSIYNLEINFITKNNQHISVSLNLSVLRDTLGKLVCIIAIARDMRQINELFSKEKEARIKLQVFSEGLEKKVNERTQELLTSQEATLNILDDLEKSRAELEQSNAELRKLDKLKSDFVSTVSHELRTPLSISKEGVSLILDGVLGQVNVEQTRVLSIARDNIDRLARIIDGLLDISKIEAGKIELKKRLVDIVAVARQILSSFELITKEKGIELKLETTQPDVTVYVDPDRIVQILTNLVGNAVKFTDKGYIEIAIRPKDEIVECCISDTGIGIAEENLPKVFGKFEQFGRVSGPGAKGTGLGLAITKAFVEMHKGRIWVESKFGEGTKFIFTLPRKPIKAMFRDFVSDNIKDAIKRHNKLTLITVSILDFEKIKEQFKPEELSSVLIDMEQVLRTKVHSSKDFVLKDTGEIAVILVDCEKTDAINVKERLQQSLDELLFSKNIHEKIKLRLGSATYPDEADNEEGLIQKAEN
ncbi:MAG: PAS domain-containing protein [Candidatus Omnitrophica bacterium]|nr:PAS domain-containing protein [Candidatus Omnitrophota bacterium]